MRLLVMYGVEPKGIWKLQTCTVVIIVEAKKAVSIETSSDVHGDFIAVIVVILKSVMKYMT